MDKDGLIYFRGRADSQIKSRGYRIELAEIEVALNTSPLLQECAVVAASSHDFDGVKICCSYVPLNGAAVHPVKLKAHLRQYLPSYMIPSHWHAMTDLPRNANGKIDRRALKEFWTEYEADSSRYA
jgi:acyl-coenzyme A synthetase/AMP-(fatty) acid ligase